ncbi:hypothetical protein C0992_000157 [Termitomyces sp. T32_za158]|nr:hypothetical protein C0992_000157 [Termitomyces sp. T32_za158]
MFCALWLPFLAVLAVSATSPAQSIRRVKRSDTVPNTTFITIHDGQFFVNGSVFQARGTNAPWLSVLNNDSDIDNTFASMRAANITVVRTWGFNDVATIPENGTWFQLIANGTQSVNVGANGLQKLDKVVESAQNHGIYLVISLTNNWDPASTDPSNGTHQQLPGDSNAIQIRQMSATNTTLPRNVLSNSYGS